MKELDMPEIRTRAFFDRPITHVAVEFSVGAKIGEQVIKSEVPGKLLQVETSGGIKTYEIVLVEGYREQGAARVWKDKRAKEIKELQPGETITYHSRSGELTFIKTRGADNILIRRLKDLETGEKIDTSSQVTRSLGLSHGDRGKLTLFGESQFRFQRK